MTESKAAGNYMFKVNFEQVNIDWEGICGVFMTLSHISDITFSRKLLKAKPRIIFAKRFVW